MSNEPTPEITATNVIENWRRCSCCYGDDRLAVIHFKTIHNDKHSSATVVTLCHSCLELLREAIG